MEERKTLNQIIKEAPFSRKLAILRTLHRLTQEEVAKKTNLSTTTIFFYENDLRNPSLTSISKIAEVFNVELEDLIN